jgi:hypothetical protein
MKIPPTLKHLSYSNLALFESCPRCWWLKYQHNFKLPVPVSWELGGNVHEAIHTYHLTGKKPVKPPIKALFDVYSDHYQPQDYNELEYRFLVDIVHPINPKKKLGLPLMVVIDRIWDEWIHEVKTSSRKYNQKDIDSRIQTCLYAYAYRTKYEKEEKGIRYNVIVKNKKPKLQILDTFVSQNDIAYGLDWIWKVWNDILESPEPKYHHPNCYRKELLP